MDLWSTFEIFMVIAIYLYQFLGYLNFSLYSCNYSFYTIREHGIQNIKTTNKYAFR